MSKSALQHSRGVSPKTLDAIRAILATDANATQTIVDNVIDAASATPSHAERSPLPVWQRFAVLKQLTGATDNFLRQFAINHPNDFRKFNLEHNGSAVYRVSAVLDAIEALPICTKAETNMAEVQHD